VSTYASIAAILDCLRLHGHENPGPLYRPVPTVWQTGPGQPVLSLGRAAVLAGAPVVRPVGVDGGCAHDGG
jgi:hypothetical protein